MILNVETCVFTTKLKVEKKCLQNEGWVQSHLHKHTNTYVVPVENPSCHVVSSPAAPTSIRIFLEPARSSPQR